MIKPATGSVRLRSADKFAWQHFWLASVMIESGKPLPARSASAKMHLTNKGLSRRLRQLRRLKSTAGLPRNEAN